MQVLPLLVFVTDHVFEPQGKVGMVSAALSKKRSAGDLVGRDIGHGICLSSLSFVVLLLLIPTAHPALSDITSRVGSNQSDQHRNDP